MMPVLALIGEGRETIPDCLPHLAERFGLSAEEAGELLPSGKQTILANRAHWARHYMARAGLVRPIRRGHYELAPDGRALLAARPDAISKADLQRYPPFREWMERSRKGSEPAERALASGSDAGDDTTPEERIARDVEQIETALADELLESMRGMTPQRFEQLIVICWWRWVTAAAMPRWAAPSASRAMAESTASSTRMP